MDSINNTNIPNSILVKGISHDDFEKLHNNIKDISNEAVKGLGKYQGFVDYINKKSKTTEWADEFVKKVEEAIKVINDESQMIDELFERIFTDWNEYQKDKVTVLDDELVETGDSDE